MLDFQLNIKIENKLEKRTEIWKANKVRRNQSLALFIPLTEDKMKDISWRKEIKNNDFIDKYNYGLFVDFSKMPDDNELNIVSLNSGIKLSNEPKECFKYPFCYQYYNFPSSYLELDVARENILKFKKQIFEKEKAIIILAKQAKELISYNITNNQEILLNTIDNVYRFFEFNSLGKNKLYDLRSCLFSLAVTRTNNDSVSVSIERTNKKSLNWVHADYKSVLKLFSKCLNELYHSLVEDRSENNDIFSKEYLTILKKISDKIEIQVNEGFVNKLLKPRLEVDAFHKFEQELFYRFEKENSRRFRIEPIIRISNDFSPQFEEDLFIRFDEEFSYRFEKEIFRKMDKNIFLNMGDEIFHNVDKEFAALFTDDIVFKKEVRFPIRFRNSYQRVLYNLIISPLIYQRRRKRRFGMSDLYIRLYYFYYVISKNMSIEDSKKFRLEF